MTCSPRRWGPSCAATPRAAIPAAAAVAPGAGADVVWKVLAEAGWPLDRGAVLHGGKNAGARWRSLFQAVGLALEELVTGLSGGRRIERTGDGAFRARA